jgi:hypothetical protein
MMVLTKRIAYYERLLKRVDEEIERSGEDYDYLQIMFEARSRLKGKIRMLKMDI